MFFNNFTPHTTPVVGHFPLFNDFTEGDDQDSLKLIFPDKDDSVPIEADICRQYVAFYNPFYGLRQTNESIIFLRDELPILEPEDLDISHLFICPICYFAYYDEKIIPYILDKEDLLHQLTFALYMAGISMFPKDLSGATIIKECNYIAQQMILDATKRDNVLRFNSLGLLQHYVFQLPNINSIYVNSDFNRSDTYSTRVYTDERESTNRLPEESIWHSAGYSSARSTNYIDRQNLLANLYDKDPFTFNSDAFERHLWCRKKTNFTSQMMESHKRMHRDLKFLEYYEITGERNYINDRTPIHVPAP